ncbi:MAG: hypothetical protein MUF77_05755 [Leptospira sp.]|jgi:hypothetical protein|nr:hypothetical protein [Leptospira sp.]
MMRAPSFISGLLAIVFLTQSVFLGSGLLGFCLESASKICTCNHGSKKEVHKNSEDALFAEGSKGSEAQDHSNHNEEKQSQTVKPTCHDAKAGETHLCSCKKSKKEASNLRAHHQVLVSDRASFILKSSIEIISYFLPSENLTLEGFSLSLLKPPRAV